MIEAATDLPLGARLYVSCGTINVMAKVVWQSPIGRCGVRFDHTLQQREVDEQIVRSEAVTIRRQRRAETKLGSKPLSWVPV